MKQIVGLFIVSFSALCLLGIQAALVEQWRLVYEERERQARIKQEVLRLERLVADVDNGFRGYVLMKQAAFLGPMISAEGKIPGVMERLGHLMEPWPELHGHLQVLRDRVTELLDTKRRLTMELEQGGEEEVLAYIRGGDGLAMAKTLALAFQNLDQRLVRRERDRDRKDAEDIEWVRWALTATATAGFLWGLGLGRATRRTAATPAPRHASLPRQHRFGESQDATAPAVPLTLRARE
jgi:CHASE3 domain sensor protein